MTLNDVLENASRETLVATLQNVLKSIESHPEVSWESTCPEDTFGGSMDDVWQDGQDNGEAYYAGAVRQIISESLNV